MTTAASIDKKDLRAKYLEERDKRLRADGNDQYLRLAGTSLARYLRKWRDSGKFKAVEFR